MYSVKIYCIVNTISTIEKIITINYFSKIKDDYMLSWVNEQ